MGFMFYAVAKGFRPGIYGTWPECERQIRGYRGARYKGFNVRGEAEAFVASQGKPSPRKEGGSAMNGSVSLSPQGRAASDASPARAQGRGATAAAAMGSPSPSSFVQGGGPSPAQAYGGISGRVALSQSSGSPPLKRGVDWLASQGTYALAPASNGGLGLSESQPPEHGFVECRGCGKMEAFHVRLSGCGHSFGKTCAQECAIFGQCPCGVDMLSHELDSCEPTQDQIESFMPCSQMYSAPSSQEECCYVCKSEGRLHITLSQCGHSLCAKCAGDCALIGSCDCEADMSNAEVDACDISQNHLASLLGSPPSPGHRRPPRSPLAQPAESQSETRAESGRPSETTPPQEHEETARPRLVVGSSLQNTPERVTRRRLDLSNPVAAAPMFPCPTPPPTAPLLQPTPSRGPSFPPTQEERIHAGAHATTTTPMNPFDGRRPLVVGAVSNDADVSRPRASDAAVPRGEISYSPLGRSLGGGGGGGGQGIGLSNGPRPPQDGAGPWGRMVVPSSGGESGPPPSAALPRSPAGVREGSSRSATGVTSPGQRPLPLSSSPLPAAGREECAICMNARKNAALIPCGHTLCYECAIKCYTLNKMCPICRKKRIRVQRLYD